MKLFRAKHTKFWLAALAAGMVATSAPAQNKKAPVLSADTSLNTKYNELKPVVSPDGSLLYFGRSNHPTSAGGRKDRADAWVATATTGDMFGNVQRLASMLNSAQADVVVGFTGNGNQLYLMRNNPESAHKADAGLYLMNADGSGSARAVTVKYFLNKAKHQDISISPDGETMLISMESYSTYGLEDLYVSFRQSDGSWGEPQNLGSDINTPMQEMSAFVAADGRTLYFTSNRSGGKGSMDIWVSTRLDNSWKRWSKPQNVSSINTAGSEMYYYEPVAGQWSYYTSTQNSEGFGDVRRIRKPEPPTPPALETTPEVITATVPLQPQPTATPAEIKDEVTELMEEQRPEIKVTLNGQVTGADGKTPLARLIVSRDNFMDSVSAASTYYIALPASGQYNIQAKAKGYLTVDTVLNLSANSNQLNLSLRPLAVGTTVLLDNVMFQQSTAVLVEESTGSLDEVVQMLKENPSMEIMLTGHTDNQGSSRANIKLSQERVNAVKSYLVSRGIDEKRIEGKGYGGTRPIASNANPESRQLNRRVEFVILKE
jgi:OOP family OmpA-OmpF porin